MKDKPVCAECDIQLPERRRYRAEENKPFTEWFTGNAPRCSYCCWREIQDTGKSVTELEMVDAVNFIVLYRGCSLCSKGNSDPYIRPECAITSDGGKIVCGQSFAYKDTIGKYLLTIGMFAERFIPLLKQ